MVRTAATSIKTTGGKSTKTRVKTGGSRSLLSPRSSARRGIGGNKLIQRPTPQWQKGIDNFLKSDSETSCSLLVEEQLEEEPTKDKPEETYKPTKEHVEEMLIKEEPAEEPSVEQLDENPTPTIEPPEEPKLDVDINICELLKAVAEAEQKENCRPYGEGTSKQIEAFSPEPCSDPVPKKWANVPVAALGSRYVPDFSLLERFENDNVQGSKRNRHVNYIS